MGTTHGVVCKKEFEVIWPDILKEKLANLATVDVVTKNECRISYGNVNQEYKFDFDPKDTAMVLVKYDSGFIFVIGTLEIDGRWFISTASRGSIDRKKQKLIHKKIVAILEEMKES